jgi:hypothetical protein
VRSRLYLAVMYASVYLQIIVKEAFSDGDSLGPSMRWPIRTKSAQSQYSGDEDRIRSPSVVTAIELVFVLSRSTYRRDLKSCPTLCPDACLKLADRQIHHAQRA